MNKQYDGQTVSVFIAFVPRYAEREGKKTDLIDSFEIRRLKKKIAIYKYNKDVMTSEIVIILIYNS